MCSGFCSYGWFDICVLVVVVMDGLIYVFWLLQLWMVLYMCSGCCSYGWFDICVLVVVVMNGSISVFWLL